MRFDNHDLGVRKIRSAGRRSGSVVITLPPEFARLEGLDCAMTLRGGASPALVLEPNLAPLIIRLDRAFTALRAGLHGADGDAPLPVDRLRIAIRPTKKVCLEGKVSLSFDEIGVLRLLQEQPRPQDFLRLVRGLVALDALESGAEADEIEDYAAALAHVVTGHRGDLDLFMTDLIAASLADVPAGATLAPATLTSPGAWAVHAKAARRLKAELSNHTIKSDTRRGARADWATALRFERLST